MAKKKKFFNEKVNETKFSLKYLFILLIFIIVIIICFFLSKTLFGGKIPDNAIIELRDKVTIKVFDDLPDKTLFFSELQNVNEKDIKVSYRKVDNKHVGTYDVTLKLFSEKFKSKLEVVDTEVPVLVAKNVQIKQGKSYKAADFVSSCTDNSKEDCKIKFYTDALDQDGNKIDFSKYSTEGSYNIQIVAYDKSGNYTSPVDATLTISASSQKKQKPIETKKECKYGNDSYDMNKDILATNVTQDGCALDLNLYQDENVTKSVNALMEQETNRLKKDFSSLNVPGSFTLNRNTQAILNNSGKGIVGFSLHMELLINDEVAESYFVKEDGTRVFSVNKYNLK